MSYSSNVSQVRPSGFHDASSHVSPCNVPPPNVLFTVPPPPLPPVPPPGFMPWWTSGEAGTLEMHQSNLQASECVPADLVTVPLGSAPDDLWLSSWLAQRRKVAPTSLPSSSPVKIFEASQSFKKALILKRELQQLFKNMENNFTTLSCEEWSEKWKEITEKQREVNMCLVMISGPDVLRKLKLALLKRRRKRLSQKNERAYRRKEKVESEDKIRQLHKNIDKWLEDMQDSVERAKREESLKVEADQVLSDVTHKKTEARRQLSLLSSLLKLRQLRARTWANRGEKVSAEVGVQFNRVIDSLRKVWEDQLQVYSVEERGLKVMLESVVEERNQKQDKRESEIIRQWEQLLFGDRRCLQERNDIQNFFSAAEKDLETFILIRSQWDKFLAPQRAPMASAIPLGWVLPVGPSSPEWAALLQKENKSVLN